MVLPVSIFHLPRVLTGCIFDALFNHKKGKGRERMINNTLFKGLMSGALVMGLASSVFASGVGGQEEPVEYLVKFVITGNPNPAGDGTFIIGGPGYSTITTSSGEILDNVVPGLKVAELSGAVISFDPFDPTMQLPPVIGFTCASGTCNIEIEGSTLTSDAGVPLDGKVVPQWGPIINSDFNPDGSSTPIRILGCGGLKDISGEGKFAGMVDQSALMVYSICRT
jgi:hypothetical protein